MARHKQNLHQANEPPLESGDTELVDAKTAALMLGVKTQTLYAYVSRGLIRTVPQRGRKRSMYRRQDVEALRMNGRGNRFSGEGSDRLVRWGTGAMLSTAITSIDAAGPRYRGKLATDLARMRRSFEDCVELLWTGVLPAQSLVWQPGSIPDAFLQVTATLTKTTRVSSSRQRLALLTGAYASCIGRSPEAALGAPVLAGRQLLQILAPCFGLLQTPPRYAASGKAESIAAIIAESAGTSPSEETIDALNACLILSADHEIPPATFAARVAASGGADIFSCVSAALGAFEGPTTGLGCDEPERLLRLARSPKEYIRTLKEYVRRKQAPLGYNHPLYPSGDPRALQLLELASSISAKTPASRLVLSCIGAATEEMGLVPSLAIGLVAVSSSLDLPEEAPGALMAIGRVSGWIAHVFEQRLAGAFIQPRTRYIGASTNTKPHHISAA